MPAWLEAMRAEDLGLVIAGNHYAAFQTMDEESRQSVTFTGAFGSEKPIIRFVRRSDEDTLSFSALLLKPGQNAGMDDETWMRNLKNFSVSAKRGARGAPSDYTVYNDCAWTRIGVASTLDQVTLSADFSGHID